MGAFGCLTGARWPRRPRQRARPGRRAGGRALGQHRGRTRASFRRKRPNWQGLCRRASKRRVCAGAGRDESARPCAADGPCAPSAAASALSRARALQRARGSARAARPGATGAQSAHDARTGSQRDGQRLRAGERPRGGQGWGCCGATRQGPACLLAILGSAMVLLLSTRPRFAWGAPCARPWPVIRAGRLDCCAVRGLSRLTRPHGAYAEWLLEDIGSGSARAAVATLRRQRLIAQAGSGPRLRAPRPARACQIAAGLVGGGLGRGHLLGLLFSRAEGWPQRPGCRLRENCVEPVNSRRRCRHGLASGS